jgi:hypothetical protein
MSSYLKIFFINPKNFFFFIFFIVINILTYYNFFSVNFFFWDDKDIIFHIERLGYRSYSLDPNLDPRYYKQIFHALVYYLFGYNYKLYKLFYVAFIFISSGIFYFFIKSLFNNNNLALLSLILFSTFTSIDVFNTSIVLLPNSVSLSLYLLSFLLTINYVQTNSYIKKILIIFSILLICIGVNLLHFPYFYFSELARILLIVYLLKKNDKISLNNIKKSFDTIIIYTLPIFIFLILFVIWILYFENKFLGRIALPAEDYQATTFLKSFINNPKSYFISLFYSISVSLTNLILSPATLMYNSLALLNDGTRFFFEKTFLIRFFLTFIFIHLCLKFLDYRYGILELNISLKQLIKFLFFFLVLIILMIMFAPASSRYLMFNYEGGFSRYALPGYIFLPLFYICIIKILFFHKKLFQILFSILLTFQITNGYLTSKVYDYFDNDKKKQLSQIAWRFDNFNQPTEIIIEDDKYTNVTTLMLDKDHWLLNILYDKPREFLNLRRFNLNEPKIFIENYYSNIDSIKNIKKNYIIAFKTKYSECYEFLDDGTYKNHPRFFYIDDFKKYKDSNEKKPNEYLLNKYYKDFNKMNLFTESDLKSSCYFYQTAKKYLNQKSFKNLEYISTKFQKSYAYEKIHNSYNEYDYFMLKPFYVSMLQERGKSSIKNLEKSINWYPPHTKIKIEILCDAISYLKINNTSYTDEFNNLCK